MQIVSTPVSGLHLIHVYHHVPQCVVCVVGGLDLNRELLQGACGVGIRATWSSQYVLCTHVHG